MLAWSARHRGQGRCGQGDHPARRRRQRGVPRLAARQRRASSCSCRIRSRPAGPTPTSSRTRCRATWDSLQATPQARAARHGRLGVQRTGAHERRCARVGAGRGRRRAASCTSLWSQGWGVTRSSGPAPTEGAGGGRELRGLRPALPPRRAEAGAGGAARASVAQALGEAAGVQHHRRDRGHREARRVRDALGALRSWDGASGATDNGTGTITMLEAMRDPQARVPEAEAHDPRRALERRGAGAQRLARLRGGSPRDRAAACRRCSTRTTAPAASQTISRSGLTGARGALRRLARRSCPTEITARHQAADSRARRRGGGTDNASFVCYGAPALRARLAAAGSTAPTPGTPTATPSTRSCSTS